MANLNVDSIRYFGGVDPAPAQSARNDDGSIAILRARLISGGEGMDASARRPYQGEETPRFSDSPSDYETSWCYLRRLRDADSSQWSGIIHGLHRGFSLSKLLMDMGASGGGLYIKKDLAKPRQKIEGIETECTPIVALDEMAIRGHFILHAFKRSDPGIELLCGKMAGDDVLLDWAHTEMRQAVMKGQTRWPKRYSECTQDELLRLGEENIWSLRNLEASLDQFQNIGVAMTEDKSSFDLTKNGARQFSAAKGRKDHQMSMMLAWIAFLIWLRFDGGAHTQSEEDATGFYGG